MTASKSRTNAKRTARKRSTTHFEFFARKKNGPDLADELARLAPTSMKCRREAGAPCLQIDGEREEVLSLRSRLLRKHPDAEIRIFEVPADAHPSWAFVDESKFVPSGDRFTFVLPGHPHEPATLATRCESPHETDLFRRACAARRRWMGHAPKELRTRKPDREMSTQVVEGDFHGYLLRDAAGYPLARFYLQGGRLRFLGHGRG